MDLRIKALDTKFVKLREEGKKKGLAELDALKATVLKLMRYHRMAKKLSTEGLFAAIDTNSDDRIEESEFLKFMATCERVPSKKEGNGDAVEDEDADGTLKYFECMPGDGNPPKLSEDELARVFNSFDEEDEGHLSKAGFIRLIRHFLKVTKDTVLTDSLAIKEGKNVRRLEPSEVLEVLEGPMKEETVNVGRLRCKMMKDDSEGWVSFSGNAGTVYMEEGGNLFKVVKETIMTDSIDLGEGIPAKPRKLKEGELLEVREWPAKQEGSGLTRMMCRARSDGRMGWATTIGNTGITFIERA